MSNYKKYLKYKEKYVYLDTKPVIKEINNV